MTVTMVLNKISASLIFLFCSLFMNPKSASLLSYLSHCKLYDFVAFHEPWPTKESYYYEINCTGVKLTGGPQTKITIA